MVPTIGRLDLLRQLLRSLAACTPAPAEVLLVDQSEGTQARRLIEEFAGLPVRVEPCDGRGPSRGLNVGLRLARHETVLITNDDCTVAEDWVAVGVERSAALPGGIVTGRVMPAGDPRAVPSIKTDLEPHDYTGRPVIDGLFGNNMVLPRTRALELGGFDERPGMEWAAEDNDFGYRWLAAGHPMRYDPDLVVWHHDWRSPEELVQRYIDYARGNGVLYAKYLLRGDRGVLRLLLRELRYGVRGTVGALLRRRPRWSDPRLGILPGLPVGLLAGIRQELALRRRRA
jgi:GT2 family glycosyltransferase